jgi:primosomal protein N' (replication factor Y)
MTHPSLFPELEPPAAVRPAGPFAVVAIERSLDRVLDYSIPPALANALCVGQRVRVPLGKNNKPAHGYVVGIQATSTYPKVKPILSITDERVLLPPKLLELARWISRYYCCPLGTTLDSIIPSAVKKKVGLGYTPMVRLAQPREDIQSVLEKTKAPKRRAVLARLLTIEPGCAIELVRLAGESNATPATVRKLVKLGLIGITSEPDFDVTGQIAANNSALIAQHSALPLNDDQQKAFDDLVPRITAGGFSVNLLHGVTGSGKTEIYLRCIKQVVESGKRAIVLVPEIALTPQTVRRFTERFSRVAVLHSGLAASARHRFWQQIVQGQADVVVGARSAIFAPLADLGIIVVDEEHESSYKQDSAPRYHARDVAIKRAQLESAMVLLGSATPSLESYWRARTSGPLSLRERDGVRAAEPIKSSDILRPPHPNPRPEGEGTKALRAGPQNPYHLLQLPRRVRGLQLACIELVDMKQELRLHRRKGVHLLSQRLEHLLKTTVEAGHQAILLLNRRGYSNFVYCPSCTHLMQCKYCDVTLTYHRSAGVHAKGGSFDEGLHTGQLHCHYCLAVNPLPQSCPACNKKLSLFGLGTQRVEEELAHKFPDLKFARVDSDTMRSARDYEALLGQFATGEIQVMLGTQMIAKGLDYPNVTLVGVISGDTALALPDFRAAERTFQLITQVAGRAGRGDVPGRVVLQTFMPDDPTIQAAIKQDYVSFAQRELQARLEVGLPPVTRMVRIILRDDRLERLHDRCEKFAVVVASAVAHENEQSTINKQQSTITLKGPMPCAINRISGYHRAQVLLFCPSPAALQRVLAAIRRDRILANLDRVAVDVDPVSLL